MLDRLHGGKGFPRAKTPLDLSGVCGYRPKSPCKNPCYREFQAETSSLQTASTANPSCANRLALRPSENEPSFATRCDRRSPALITEAPAGVAPKRRRPFATAQLLHHFVALRLARSQGTVARWSPHSTLSSGLHPPGPAPPTFP